MKQSKEGYDITHIGPFCNIFFLGLSPSCIMHVEKYSHVSEVNWELY